MRSWLAWLALQKELLFSDGCVERSYLYVYHMYHMYIEKDEIKYKFGTKMIEIIYIYIYI